MECAAPGLVNPCLNNATGASQQLFMALINTLFVGQCMLGRSDQYPPDSGPLLKDLEEFDFIVVGAGSAGSVVASRLSENPNWRVLLLEAGGIPSASSDMPNVLFTLQNTAEDWKYVTEKSDLFCLGFRNETCKWPRGKALGGSSSINAMLYIRGDPQIYDNWSQNGNLGWDYKQLLPYFHMSENLQVPALAKSQSYGRNGPLTLNRYEYPEPIRESLIEAFKELKYPYLEEEGTAGFLDAIQTIDTGVRQNAAKAFLRGATKRSNLVLAMNAHVKRVLICPKTKTALAVEVRIGAANGRDLKLYANKEVILSAGAINSAQLLMLSGVGPKDHLETHGIKLHKDLKVGENLQDHLIYSLFHVKTKDSTMSEVTPNVMMDDIYRYTLSRQGSLGKIGATNMVSFINTKHNSGNPNIQFHFTTTPRRDIYTLPVLVEAFQWNATLSQELYKQNKHANLVQIVPTLLNPKSRGKIILKSNDPFREPAIHPGYLSDRDGEDMQTFLEGIRFAENITRTKAFRELDTELIEFPFTNCKQHTYRSDEYWRCAIRQVGTTVYHPVGTCKMGPSSDTEAVVDSQLKVHGIDHLRVIDASIMPTITSGNTNAPSIMIGQRGAQFIKDTWKGL